MIVLIGLALQAKMSHDTNRRAIGFPAFDQAKALLGFYQESQQVQETTVVFTPSSRLQLGVEDLQSPSRLLQKDIDAVSAPWSVRLNESGLAHIHTVAHKHTHTLARITGE